MSFDFKNATLQERQKEHQRIAQLNDVSYQSYAEHFYDLTALLGDNEEFYYILMGRMYAENKIYRGLALLLQNRIMFVLYTFFHSSKVKVVYLNKINSFEYYNEGFLRGKGD